MIIGMPSALVPGVFVPVITSVILLICGFFVRSTSHLFLELLPPPRHPFKRLVSRRTCGFV